MRIIAGSIKGRKLVAPPGEDLRVRPTSDRAREALFSILQRWPQGPFLDLCAGTGAVGLEAWSRGYAPVTCVESGEPGWSALQANLKGTSVMALRKDVTQLAPGDFPPQAIVFLDPPYAQATSLWERLAPRLREWVRPDGLVVVETDRATTLELQTGLELAETRLYGAACFHLLRPH
ncbi:MAG TPA: RsmD family RNA methyltransferase [Holophagaceae bacterium]|nr:RsmD family RNA methyltransferase [Holophagaceae bacterium]